MTEKISPKQQLILDQIVPFIAEKLGVDPAEVTMESHLANDLGADSLDSVELLMEFEKKFHLSIPDDKQKDIHTVGDVVCLVDSMGGKPQSKTVTTPIKTTVKSSNTTKKEEIAPVNQTKKTATVKPRKKAIRSQDLLEMKVKEVFEMPMGDVIRLMMQLRQAKKR